MKMKAYRLLFIIVFLYSCKKSNNKSLPVGVQKIVLTGSISNDEAQQQITSQFGTTTQEIDVVQCNNLTSVDLSVVTNILTITVSNNAVLQQINLSKLSSVQNGLSIVGCPALINLDITSLQQISQGTANWAFQLDVSGIQNIDFVNLTTVSGNISISNNAEMAAASFPRLADASNAGIYIEGNEITTISFALLNKIRQLQVFDNRKLNNLSVPSLTNSTSLLIQKNVALPSISFPKLTNVNTELTCEMDSSITSVSMPLLATAGSLNFQYNPALQSFSAPALTSDSIILITDNDHLTTISFPSLLSISGTFSFNNNPSVSSFSFPVLQTANEMNISTTARFHTSFASLSLPKLTSVQNLTLAGDSDLQSVSLPMVTTAKNILIFGDVQLENVDLSILNTVTGSLSIFGPLTSLSLPSLVSAGSLAIGGTLLNNINLPSLSALTDSTSYSSISGNENLTGVSIVNLTVFKNYEFDLNLNAFGSTEINSLLSKFVSVSPQLTGKNFILNQYMAGMGVPAPPTGQGITDKATLISRGNNVLTD